MKKTKNNKGFSLVELIVVVLILGILAVAVTPQVMKWVGKSKVSADKDSANALKSAVTTALADWQAEDGGKLGATGSDLQVKIGAGTAPYSFTAFDSGSWTDDAKLITRINEVTSGDYPNSKYDANGFTVKIFGGTGKVEITYGAKNVTE
ncbi:MAG: type II secretion system protein [Lachnospiraceae bacterium]|nr:type II secretion system protein [Lachnospiraceae bacterium]